MFIDNLNRKWHEVSESELEALSPTWVESRHRITTAYGNKFVALDPEGERAYLERTAYDDEDPDSDGLIHWVAFIDKSGDGTSAYEVAQVYETDAYMIADTPDNGILDHIMVFGTSKGTIRPCAV